MRESKRSAQLVKEGASLSLFQTAKEGLPGTDSRQDQEREIEKHISLYIIPMELAVSVVLCANGEEDAKSRRILERIHLQLLGVQAANLYPPCNLHLFCDCFPWPEASIICSVGRTPVRSFLLKPVLKRRIMDRHTITKERHPCAAKYPWSVPR